MMPALLGITAISAPFYSLRFRRFRADPVDHAAGQNCRRVDGCFTHRLRELAIGDRKLKGGRVAFRRVFSGAEEFTLRTLRYGFVFETGCVAGRVTVIVLDRTTAGDDVASLPNL